MKLRVVSVSAVLLLAAAVAVNVSAQSPGRSGVAFVKPASNLGPEMVELLVRDAKSGTEVSHALICLDTDHDWVVTNEKGHVRLGNLPANPQRIRVEALGFAPESLDVEVKRDDRRSAVVRLKPRAETRATLACERSSRARQKAVRRF